MCQCYWGYVKWAKHLGFLFGLVSLAVFWWTLTNCTQKDHCYVTGTVVAVVCMVVSSTAILTTGIVLCMYKYNIAPEFMPSEMELV